LLFCIYVAAVPHRDLGEAVVAVCVLCAKFKHAAEGTLHSALKQTLAGYKIPKKIIFVKNLPRNSMAKVQKNVLRQTYRDVFSKSN
jgi:malonyl-CoA/methylmalonyl-CoA synthetase